MNIFKLSAKPPFLSIGKNGIGKGPAWISHPMGYRTFSTSW